MSHKLFRLDDLWLVGIVFGIVSLTTFAVGWNWFHEVDIPIGGWVSSAGAVLIPLVILAVFYAQRWMWVQRYAYTVRGVEYYYASLTPRYLRLSVSNDIDKMLVKWGVYFGGPFDHMVLTGVVCIFRPEASWIHTAPGWWSRKVTGIQMGNVVVVGTGSMVVEGTAHAHELSHVFLERQLKRYVGEAEAHGIFKEAGV